MQVPENAQIKHAHYCSLAFRPLMPQRADFELIVTPLREPLRSLFGEASAVGKSTNQTSHVDIFADLLNFSQYFHYVFLKMGTCFPIDCSPRDVQRVAKLIGRRWSFQTGPVKCNSKFASDYEELEETTTSDGGSQKALQISTTRDLNDGVFIWKPHMTNSQFWALIILGSIILVISAATLADLVLNQVAKLKSHLGNLTKETAGLRAQTTNGENSISIRSHELNVLHNTKLASDEDSNNNIAYQDDNNNLNSKTTVKLNHLNQIQGRLQSDAPIGGVKSPFRMLIQDLSAIENAKAFFTPTRSPRDISCLHGIRCLTMIWIIITHTMQYNDWSAFARAREVEVHLRSLVTQPLFNGSYLVDTFFVISGLLTSYTIFSERKTLREISQRFSCFNYLLNRYLRLTPAVLFVSGLFILLPLAIKSSGSPHWYTMTGEYSEFCSRNWWIQILHLQAFYKPAEMCNFASWWISVDSFFHLIGLFVLLIIFSANRSRSESSGSLVRESRKYALGACLSLATIGLLVQFSIHYYFKLPPNMMSTIPQTEAMFSITTLYFFWTPIAHSMPFLLGLLSGYLLAREQELLLSYLSWPRALVIWSCVIALFVLQLFSTYFWIIGQWSYKPALMATTYNVSSTLLWSATLIWIILACKLNFGGPINAILSCKLFSVLSKASYLVYLSHFLVLFTFFGSQNLLLEPSQLIMTYVIMGNICISMLFGSFLCVTLEMPWLKLHKRLMSKLPPTSHHLRQQQTNDATTTTTPTTPIHSTSLGA